MELKDYLEKCAKGKDLILKMIDNLNAPIRFEGDRTPQFEEDYRPGMTIQEKVDFESFCYAFKLLGEHEYIGSDYRTCQASLDFLESLISDFDRQKPFTLDEDGHPDLSALFEKYKL